MKKSIVLIIILFFSVQCKNPVHNKDDLDKIIKEFNQEFDKANNLRFDYKEEHHNAFDFQLDNSKYLQKIIDELKLHEEKNIINHYKLFYVAFASLNPDNYEIDRAKIYFNDVNPRDSAWVNIPQAYFSFHLLFPAEEFERIQNEFLENSSSRFIKVTILANKLPSLKSENPDKFNEIFSLIKNEYNDLTFAKSIIRMFEENSALKIGSEIPDFKFVSLEDTTKVFTKDGLLGRKYLIDFWATWCKPCLEEIPFIEKAHIEYDKNELFILSVSIDRKKEAVEKYRNDFHPMNWENIFLSGTDKKKIISDFEIIGIPKPFLINEEGKIIAMDFELRGDKLAETLAKYIK